MLELAAQTSTWTFILIPLAIMLARICDVTLGTMRIIFLSINDIRSVQEGHFPKRMPAKGVYERLLNTSLKRK